MTGQRIAHPALGEARCRGAGLTTLPVGFLSDNQAREYGRFPSELTPDQLARYFHLDDADRAFVALHRGDHNRLGATVQLGSLRMLGMFLERPEDVPLSALRFIARQLPLPNQRN